MNEGILVFLDFDGLNFSRVMSTRSRTESYLKIRAHRVSNL